MGKNQDPVSGIRNKHPGSATLFMTHNWHSYLRRNGTVMINNTIAIIIIDKFKINTVQYGYHMKYHKC
jgi:hypothetical protein